MKKILFLLAILPFVIYCSAQERIDLSNTHFYSVLKTKNSNLIKEIDLDQTTGFPYYSTHRVDDYTYLDIQFKSDYLKKKPYIKSSIGFLVNNQNENKILGFYISTKNFKESEEIINELKHKYHNPKTINIANENWPYSGYYWKNTFDGFDILLSQSKEEISKNDKKINGFFTEVYFVKSGLKIGNMKVRESIVENFITRQTQN